MWMKSSLFWNVTRSRLLFTDVSGQPIVSIFKCQGPTLDPWKRDRQDVPKHRYVTTIPRCLTYQKSEGPDYVFTRFTTIRTAFLPVTMRTFYKNDTCRVEKTDVPVSKAFLKDRQVAFIVTEGTDTLHPPREHTRSLPESCYLLTYLLTYSMDQSLSW
jgi:hypothetical protein